MKRIVSTGVLLAFLAVWAHPQTRRTPVFSQYPAVVERARAASINFRRSPDARTYRTRLSDALGEGVNFAGHYVIAGWGCGTGCTNGAVIDARDGRVFWPVEFYNLDARYGDGYADPLLDFKKNSRLLVIHGRPGTKDENGPEQPEGDYYYEWRNNRFRLLKVVKKTP